MDGDIMDVMWIWIGEGMDMQFNCLWIWIGSCGYG